MAKIITLPTSITDDFDWATPRTIECSVTPKLAESILQHRNPRNRPLIAGRAEALARAVEDGAWVDNGDAIRFDRDGKLLDGQHRLWMVVLTGRSIKLRLVLGLDPEVFDTIDIGARRSGADTVAVLGVSKYRQEFASACQWLARWQRGDFQRALRALKVSNHDVKTTARDNPDLIRSVERCTSLRSIVNPGLMAAVHYRVALRDPDLAERLVETLLEPGGVGVTDPFFVFRDIALEGRKSARRRDPITLLALLIKAVNAAAAGKRTPRLQWRVQGRGAEAFPKLEI